MTEPLPDTWHNRDLPTLRTMVRMLEENPGNPVHINEITSSLRGQLSEDEVKRAAAALESGGLVELEWENWASGYVLSEVKRTTGTARELAGAWPSADNIADRLLAILDDLAEHGDDEVTRSKARKAGAALGSFTRDTLVASIGAAVGVALQ